MPHNQNYRGRSILSSIGIIYNGMFHETIKAKVAVILFQLYEQFVVLLQQRILLQNIKDTAIYVIS